MIKVCRVCKKEHETSRKDSICLSCRRMEEKEWRLKRKLEGRPVIPSKMPRDYHRKYEAEYYAKPQNKKRRAMQMSRYQSPNSPVRFKHEARWQLRRAVKAGRIKRLPCENCGNPKSQAHHHDYSKPLEVKWLCVKCHNLEHTKAGVKP